MNAGQAHKEIIKLVYEERGSFESQQIASKERNNSKDVFYKLLFLDL